MNCFSVDRLLKNRNCVTCTVVSEQFTIESYRITRGVLTNVRHIALSGCEIKGGYDKMHIYSTWRRKEIQTQNRALVEKAAAWEDPDGRITLRLKLGKQILKIEGER